MTRHPIPGVGVAVVRRGELLLVRRGRGALAGKWAVPGGKVDYGERLEEAARREVAEETGLQVRIGPVIWVGESLGPGTPPEWHYVLVDFLGEVVGGETTPGDDATDLAWVALDRVEEYDLTPTMFGLLDALRDRDEHAG